MTHFENCFRREKSFKKWPHLRKKKFAATPETLARAGFFFNPSKASPDNATCVYCHKNLEHWQPQDEPFALHRMKSPACCYVSLEHENSRLQTFVNWPHKHPSPQLLVKAGFYMNCVNEDDEDVATCYQCGITLGNWEPEDDPTVEHSKRNPLCCHLLHGRRGIAAYYEIFNAGRTSEILREKPFVEPIVVETPGNDASATEEKIAGISPLSERPSLQPIEQQVAVIGESAADTTFPSVLQSPAKKKKLSMVEPVNEASSFHECIPCADPSPTDIGPQSTPNARVITVRDLLLINAGVKIARLLDYSR